ncbi:MAG TPA: thrombospondin type 3 repeat-containing protein [Kofleriaceae bacterium]|nr:thrombospondin type 3 repeat-containing protein [Kofleriaceae bacterium]
MANPAAPPDRDGDGVPDARDLCPDHAGLPRDGCPPRDSDGDGVDDAADRCPEDAGPPANQGCPDRDSDGDGVPDRLDECPVVMGPEDLGGCPPADADDDGVPDAVDRCPDEAEVWNGRRDTDGCPDPGQALIHVGQGKVVFVRPVRLDPRGRLRVTDRAAVEAAATALRMARAQRVALMVVADYGLSYGDSLQRAVAQAALLRATIAAAAGLPIERVIAGGRGPDGNPRIELVYR